MLKTINYFIQSIFIYFFFIIGKILGLKLSRKFFSFLFHNIAPFFKSKKIIENNLEIFLNENSKYNKESIIKSMWENYGKTFIEYKFLKFFINNNSHILLHEETKLKEIEKGKQVIFVSGHFSNFELMSMEITKKGIPLATIYRPLNNFFLNPFMEYLRKKYVCPNQIKKGLNGVKEAISFISRGYNIALMIDQRVSEGEKVDFFKKPALTTTLPAQLSFKYDLPIVPVFIERNSANNFKISFMKEIKPSDYKGKSDLTLKVNKIIENMIEKNPNEWIWTHNRWK